MVMKKGFNLYEERQGRVIFKSEVALFNYFNRDDLPKTLTHDGLEYHLDKVERMHDGKDYVDYWDYVYEQSSVASRETNKYLSIIVNEESILIARQHERETE